jgi:hypothetical protein
MRIDLHTHIVPAAIPRRPREYARPLHFDSLTHGAANLRFLIAGR